MLASSPQTAGSPEEVQPTQQVLVVDDHDAMRRALTELIDLQGDLTVCAATATAEDAVEAVVEHRPDAAVIDVSLPGMNGIELTRWLHDRWPNLPVVVISSHPATRFEQAALDAGARAYLVKREAAVRLIQVLRTGLDAANLDAGVPPQDP